MVWAPGTEGRFADESIERGDRTRGVRQLRWPNACSMSRKKANGCLPRTRDRVTVAGMRNAQATPSRSPEPPARLTARQRQVLEFIDSQTRQPGDPPSVREIGEAGRLPPPPPAHAPPAALPRNGPPPRHPPNP